MFDWLNNFLIKTMGLPMVASEHGEKIDFFIVYVHWLMLALFLGWTGYFLYTIYRFRASNNPKASYRGVQSHASSYVEIAVAIIEVVLLLGFAIPLWANVVEDEMPDENDPTVTVVRVVGEQFFWNARYPGADGFAAQDFRLVTADNKFGYDLEDDAGKDDAIAPQNEIHVPVGKEVIIHLSALDVIHSFSLHAMRVGQDCIPGMSIPIHFKPHTEGTYAITCAQLCGNGHYRMRANLTVESQAAFEAWIVENTPEDPAAANQAFE
ncbi:MAG: cytochrome c oxidase subunit II [Verrucomicrobiia bacterium]|jgi:cytochrome c oxidase subunit 2